MSVSKILPSIVFLLFFFTIFSFFSAIRINLYQHPQNLALTDFTAYLAGSLMIKENKGRLLYHFPSFFEYESLLTSPLSPPKLTYRALPFTVLFYLPLINLDLFASFSIFAGFSFLSLISICFLSRFIFPPIRHLPFWFLLPFAFVPSFKTVFYGQTAIITTLFFMLSCLFILRHKYFTAGILLSFLLVKMQIFLSLAFFLLLLFPKIRLFWGFFTGIILSLIISLLLVGIDNLISYPSYLINSETLEFGSHIYDFQSLPSIFLRLLPDSVSRPVLSWGLSFLAFVFVVFLLKTKTLFFPPRQKLAVAAILSPLFAFHTPDYELVLYLFPIFFLLHCYFTHPRLSRNYVFFWLALFIFLACQSFFFSSFNAFSVPIFLLIGLFLALHPISPAPIPKPPSPLPVSVP